mgnify:CR=1 FL=1
MLLVTGTERVSHELSDISSEDRSEQHINQPDVEQHEGRNR